MAVDSVGIAAGDGGDYGAFRGDVPAAAVADGAVRRFQLFDLQNLDLQRCNGRELCSGKGANSVDAYSQAHHVELVLRETFYSGGIEDVPERFVA